MHFDRLYHGNILPATQPSRRWQLVSRDLKVLTGNALLFLLGLALLDAVGHVVGYLWWAAKQW